jgi:hypothetical protein
VRYVCKVWMGLSGMSPMCRTTFKASSFRSGRKEQFGAD